MAFLLPRDPLTPKSMPRGHVLQAHIASGSRVVRAADIAAWAEAEGLIAAARAQADAIVAGAQAAFEEERQRGYADGMAEAQMEQAEKMIETVSRTVDYFSGVETDMVALVMSAVRKIIDGYDDADRVLIVVPTRPATKVDDATLHEHGQRRLPPTPAWATWTSCPTAAWGWKPASWRARSDSSRPASTARSPRCRAPSVKVLGSRI